MEEMSMFLLRSTYFNAPIGNRIHPEWFYISIPTHEVKKIPKGKFEKFMSGIYEENFDNPDSNEKMLNDSEKFFRHIKRNIDENIN